VGSDSVVGALYHVAGAAAEHIFVDFEGRKFTFGDVWSRASALAEGLRQAGVRPGDTVVSLFDNHEDGLSAWFGANMLGAIWIPANTALRGDFLRHLVVDSGARVVLCETDLLDRRAFASSPWTPTSSPARTGLGIVRRATRLRC
jgi:carnitine-CoA ligase